MTTQQKLVSINALSCRGEVGGIQARAQPVDPQVVGRQCRLTVSNPLTSIYAHEACSPPVRLLLLWE